MDYSIKSLSDSINLSSIADHILQKAVINWAESLLFARHYSYLTVKNYLFDLADFFRFLLIHTENNLLSLENLEHLTVADLRAWLAYRINNKISHRSNRRASSALRTFYRYLDSEYSIKNTAFFSLKLRKKAVALPSVLTNEQIIQSLQKIASISRTEWMRKRDLAVALLLYSSGIRISEALKIRLTDIEVKNKTVQISGKGNKNRIAILLPIVINAIMSYIDVCPYPIAADLPIFYGARGKSLNPDVYRYIIRQMRGYLDIPQNTSPHTFRHSFATALLNSSVSTRVIQQLLGHSSIASTEIYTHVSHAAVLDAHRRFHPHEDD